MNHYEFNIIITVRSFKKIVHTTLLLRNMCLRVLCLAEHFSRCTYKKSYLMFNKKVTLNSKHETRLMIDLPK